MTSAAELRLRRFLLLVTVFVCVGAIVELLLVEHTGSWIQLVPIVAAALGASVAIAGIRWHGDRVNRRFLRVFRAVMVGMIAVSALGVFQHIRANYLFVIEIKPATGTLVALREALTGASPLLASGILVVAAACGLMATIENGSGETENQDSVR